MIPPAAGTDGIPLPGTGEAGYKEAPERLDARLPDSREPLTGVGARGNVDATKGFGTELPLGIPEIDMMPGTGLGDGDAEVERTGGSWRYAHREAGQHAVEGRLWKW